VRIVLLARLKMFHAASWTLCLFLYMNEPHISRPVLVERSHFAINIGHVTTTNPLKNYVLVSSSTSTETATKAQLDIGADSITDVSEFDGLSSELLYRCLHRTLCVLTKWHCQYIASEHMGSETSTKNDVVAYSLGRFPKGIRLLSIIDAS
jgi:hypothetical protein